MMTSRLAALSAREQALADAEAVARTTVAACADDVDKRAVFPEASISALAEADLLKASLPVRFGGLGLDSSTLAGIARILGHSCGSTAMIWAMHQVQVACVARHLDADDDVLAGLLASTVCGGGLIASVTTERGIGGNLRQSHTCCITQGDRLTLAKDTPTISYPQNAEAFLITARRSPEAAPSEQVIVLAAKNQTDLQITGDWNAMGMRGTRSPGCRIAADVTPAQVLATPFAEIAARTMVPLSHILWSAVWIGIAEEAAGRAIRFLRRAQRKPNLESGPDLRLAAVGERLGALNGLLHLVIKGYEQLCEPGTDGPTTDFTVEVNNLKVAASTETVKVTETALEICGMPGYQEHGEFSVARMLRDLYSARLMISNSRLQEANATAMLMRRYG
jgi:acyl-CoA dehydrogenase